MEMEGERIGDVGGGDGGEKGGGGRGYGVDSAFREREILEKGAPEQNASTISQHSDSNRSNSVHTRTLTPTKRFEAGVPIWPSK